MTYWARLWTAIIEDTLDVWTDAAREVADYLAPWTR